MCGLIGIFGAADKKVPSRDCLNHRGPDAFGTYKDSHVVLAHNRLAVIDLDKRSNQPMVGSKGKSYIIFNGEIYNFKVLKKELVKKGVKFFTESDTEVIIKGFEEYGLDWFRRLDGMFAIAIYDQLKESITLARDRFGIKPLYYFLDNDLLYFASEHKAFRDNRSYMKKKISRKAFSEYLHYGYSLENQTILDQVNQVPPGSILTKSIGKALKIISFYSFSLPNYKKNLNYDLPVIVKNIRQLVTDSIKKQFVSDVPVSILLSSGVDSNIIAHVAAKELGISPITYTARFELGNSKDDEVDIAQLSAKMAGLDHNVVDITVDNLPTILQNIVNCYEEPFADPAAIPIYLLASKISKNEKVVLQGDGGDEFFGGYNRYSRLTYARSYKKFAALIYSLRYLSVKNPALHKKFRFFGCFRSDNDASFFSALMTNEMPDFKYKNLLNPDFVSFIDDNSHELKYCQSLPMNSQMYSLADLSMFIDKQIILPSCYLRKVDRATMAFGLEARVPFLDNSIAEYMSSLPAEIILGKNSKPKYLLKKAFEDVLPKFIISGQKRGFTVPISEWLRGPLYDFASEKFIRSSHIFSNKVLKLLAEHKLKQQEHSYILWKLLIFCLWNENYGRL